MENIQPGFVFISFCFSVVSVWHDAVLTVTILKDTAGILNYLPVRNLDVHRYGILT